MPDEKLSAHFRLSELLVSSTADALGMANTPTRKHLANLRDRLAPGLEQVRAVCGGRPLVVRAIEVTEDVQEGRHPLTLRPDPRLIRLVGAQEVRGEVTADQVGQPLEEQPRLPLLRLVAEPESEPELGVVLEQGVVPRRAASLGVRGPRRRRQVAPVDR